MNLSFRTNVIHTSLWLGSFGSVWGRGTWTQLLLWNAYCYLEPLRWGVTNAQKFTNQEIGVYLWGLGMMWVYCVMIIIKISWKRIITCQIFQSCCCRIILWWQSKEPLGWLHLAGPISHIPGINCIGMIFFVISCCTCLWLYKLSERCDTWWQNL